MEKSKNEKKKLKSLQIAMLLFAHQMHQSNEKMSNLSILLYIIKYKQVPVHRITVYLSIIMWINGYFLQYTHPLHSTSIYHSVM